MSKGADTHLGHMTSYDYDPLGAKQPSFQNQEVKSSTMRSRASKAYGMEHGNWMDMDASIQNTTLQDTIVHRNQSKDEERRTYFEANPSYNMFTGNQSDVKEKANESPNRYKYNS